MKAGTAQKMILNMISTGVMIKQGKVYENIMIDVKPTNSKLIDRACRIIQVTTNAPIEKALNTLKETNNDVGLAIIMLKNNQSLSQAKSLLSTTNGNVAEVLNKELAN